MKCCFAISSSISSVWSDMPAPLWKCGLFFFFWTSVPCTSSHKYPMSCDAFIVVVLRLSSSYTSSFLNFPLQVDWHQWAWKSSYGNTNTGLGICKDSACTSFSFLSNKLGSICRSDNWWFEYFQWKRRQSWQDLHSDLKSRSIQWCLFPGVQFWTSDLMIF